MSFVDKTRRAGLACWLLFCFLSILPPHLEAQEAPIEPGQVVGQVLDSETGEPISMARVVLDDPQLSALSDLKGRYRLTEVPSGTHALTIHVLGYAEKTVTGVEVSPGSTVSLDIAMVPRAIQLEAFSVSVESERGSVAHLLDQQRVAAAVTDAIGAQDISRSPDSDAAESARRMTGVTVAEGRYVYVRGLGERYSQTALNGSPLPSPEPERSVVPLDLFPSGFLESLATQKTYTPDRPADFSGGSIQIATREFPREFRGRLGVGTSLNTESQFAPGWLSMPSGGMNMLGFNKRHQLPGLVDAELGGLDGDALPSDPETRERLGEAFLRDGLSRFSPGNGSTPANGTTSLSVGSRTDFLGVELGYLVAGTYSNKYTLRDREVERKWRASSFDPSIPEDRRNAANVDYLFTSGTRNVNWGTIGNFNLLFSPSHQLSLKTLYNRSAEEEARRFVGANREDLGGVLVDERLRYIGRSLLWGQLSGDHRLGPAELAWKGSMARATRDEPGLREAIYKRPFSAAEDDPFTLDNTGESARYLFSSLADDDRSGQLDVTLPLGSFGDSDVALKVGGMARQRSREFAARRFRFEFQGGSSITNLEEALSTATVVGRVTRPGEFALTEIVEPGDVYDVEDDAYAAYAMADLRLTPRLRLVGGVRGETYDLALTARGDGNDVSVDQTDILPAVNVTFNLTERMNLRAAWSRTLDRPEFREIAPFQFTDAASLRQVFGNPELRIARIESFDLRWEWFPAVGEVYTLSGFHKSFEDPIEQVFIASASSGYSFQNAQAARLYGIELGLRKRLGSLASWLEGFSFQGNAALIDSEVRVRTGGIFDPTNLKRSLEGQSPWTLNTNLVYQTPDGGTEAGLYLNMFGERIVAAGGSGVPDIKEQPRPQVDFTVQRDLWRGLRLNLEAENLLDAEHRWEQRANGITQIQRVYRSGRTFSLNFTYGH